MSDDENRVTEQTPPLPGSAVGTAPKLSSVLDDEEFEEEHPEENEEVKTSDEIPPDVPEDNPEVVQNDLIIKIDKATLNQAITQDKPIFVFLEDEKSFRPSLALLPTSKAEYERSFQQLNLDTLPEKDFNWIQKSGVAAQVAYEQDTLLNASTRKGSSWSFLVQRDDVKNPIGMRRDKFKSVQNSSGEVSGSAAVDMFMAGTNLGRSVNIPLWHSGFWIKMQAPTAAYLAEIDRALAFAKEEIGLDVFGVIGSNDRLIFDEILIDAALKLVVKSSFPISKSPLELKDYISSFDIDSIIWGMGVAAYPDGCDIAIPCTSCRSIAQIKANLMRMNFVDESRLTLKQLTAMNAGINSPTNLDKLKEYQEEFAVVSAGSFTYKHSKFIFKIPTITEYLISGRQYISGVSRAIYEVLKEDYTDDNKRANALSSMLSAEDCCRYGHFIESILIADLNDPDNQQNKVVDDSSIIQILRAMSGDQEAVGNFGAAVSDYISEATNTIIGFPNVACPKCGKFHLSSQGEATIVIPFNAAVGFFTLAQRKIINAGVAPLTELSMLGVNPLLLKASANMEME